MIGIRMILSRCCAAAALVFGFATVSTAAVVVNITEDGAGNVVFDYSGSMSLTDAALVGSGVVPTFAVGDYAGGPSFYALDTFYDGYIIAMSGDIFGTPIVSYTASLIGDPFGIIAPGGGTLYVSPGYVSGGAINGVATLSSQTLTSLGLTRGQYVTTLANSDTVIFNVGVAPVPLPASLPLLLASLGGLGMMRRLRRAARYKST